MPDSISFKQANQSDLVDYLQALGYRPARIRNNDYWYLSPLREEKAASFKDNRKLNVWYDHGIGAGGTLIDFGIAYFKCTAREFILRLNSQPVNYFSFHSPGQKKAVAMDDKICSKVDEKKEGRIIIQNEKPITSVGLVRYLNSRAINLEVAGCYCREIVFELYGKIHKAIGFKNGSGGYELRNENFKGSSSPKEPLLVHENTSGELSVFEGFFNFLSFKTMLQLPAKIKLELPGGQGDFLILNSLSFFEKSRDKMEQYETINLYLDRDAAGLRQTQEALNRSSRYKDQSYHYKDHKDLNELLKQLQKQQLKQGHHRGMHL